METFTAAFSILLRFLFKLCVRQETLHIIRARNRWYYIIQHHVVQCSKVIVIHVFSADEFIAPSDHSTNPASPCVHHDPSLYSDDSLSQLSHRLPSNDLLTYEQADLRHSFGHGAHPAAHQGNRPRIEITCSDLHHHRDHVHTSPVNIHRPMLTVPGYDMPYRESQCLSPASSTSSTSWHSDGCSPCVSPNGSGGAGMAAVTEALQAIQASGSPNTSPRTSITEDTFLDRRSSSPRSRSSSPQGKRTYHQYQTQRSPSPCCGPDEPPEFCGHLSNLEDSLNHLGGGLMKPIPTKMVRSSQECSVYTESLFSSVPEVKTQFTAESCYFIPSANWSSPTLAGVCRYVRTHGFTKHEEMLNIRISYLIPECLCLE